MRSEVFVRIAAKVTPCPPSTCLLWEGCTNKGYGVTWVDGKNRMVHRLVWQYYHGPIPDGMCICHKCDVLLCVNIDHLFIGSQAENRMDCVKKERHAKGSMVGTSFKVESRCYGDRNGSRKHPERLMRGENHYLVKSPSRSNFSKLKYPHKGEENGTAKLTDVAIMEIRGLWATGKYRQRDIAERYHVTQAAIWYVLHGKTWKHV